MALTIAQRSVAERDAYDHTKEELQRGTEVFSAVYTIVGSLFVLAMLVVLTIH